MRGNLAKIQRQIEAAQRGEKLVEGPEAHVQAIVGAIEGIRLQQKAGRDYTPHVEALGQAVADALSSHGDALVKALGGLSLSVEAPVVNVTPEVNVAAPQVEVTAEIELPETGEMTYHINRDRNGLIESVTVRPNQPTETALNVEME